MYVQALALQMRGEGKAYKKPLQKKAKVESATQHGGLYSASQLQGAAQQADEEGSRPAHSVQVGPVTLVAIGVWEEDGR